MTTSGPPAPEKSLLSHYLDAYMATGAAALGMAALLFLVPQTAAILSQTSLTGEFSVDP